MRPTLDCDACGGPMPAGRLCPQCGARPRTASLRTLFLKLALAAITACCIGTSAYGISPTGGTEDLCPKPPGQTCVCEGDLTCTCDDAGACVPAFPCQGRAPGDVCACLGTQTCTCSAAGACAPAEDGG